MTINEILIIIIIIVILAVIAITILGEMSSTYLITTPVDTRNFEPECWGPWGCPSNGPTVPAIPQFLKNYQCF